MLNPRKSKHLQSINFESVYVGMSRVRKREDLRIWPIREDQMEHLLKMKPSRDFTLWVNNYNNNKWITEGLHDEHNKWIMKGKKMLRA